MATLKHRPWVPARCERLVEKLAEETARAGTAALAERIDRLIARNREIHERQCFNLNPATNVMNPRAEAVLAAGLGSRPSLGYPGDKYETGLEAIEEIEVIAAELCAEIFRADHVEFRVPSGAIANLYGFMATCRPGDAIIVPPATIGGHITHQDAGCAGLYGLEIHAAPVDAQRYTIDLDSLRMLAREVKPKLITLGGSLNLFPHPVAAAREIADESGAFLMIDAAHQCGLFAGRAWPDPLREGAHLMTMSTYKSLGGPAAGLLVTNDAAIAERLDAIAFPGMTANFDAAKTAALAITMLDWREYGRAYAAAMIRTARAFAMALDRHGLPVYAKSHGFTESHQFALEAAPFGGGQAAAKRLRRAGFLACGIGLPLAPVAGDLNGLRIGTPELVRWGIEEAHIETIASLFARALKADEPELLAPEVAALRAEFSELHYVRRDAED